MEKNKINETLSMIKIQNHGVMNLHFILPPNIGNLSETDKIQALEEEKPIVENRSRLKEMRKLIMDCSLKVLTKRLFDGLINHRVEIVHLVWGFFSGGINYNIWIIISIITLAVYYLKYLGIE